MFTVDIIDRLIALTIDLANTKPCKETSGVADLVKQAKQLRNDIYRGTPADDQEN